MVDGIAIGDDGLARCWWADGDPLNRAYHDTEWGRPVSDDRRLFEKLCLEGFQSGLSWLTILRKRPNFRHAFLDFDPAAVAAFDDADVERLMQDTGIVRNRAKIDATINNARRYPELVAEFGSLAAYMWRYEPDAGRRPDIVDHAALTAVSVSPGVGCDEQGSSQAGLGVRGADDRVRGNGGDGPGQRPSRPMRHPYRRREGTPPVPATAGSSPAANLATVASDWLGVSGQRPCASRQATR